MTLLGISCLSHKSTSTVLVFSVIVAFTVSSIHAVQTKVSRSFDRESRRTLAVDVSIHQGTLALLLDVCCSHCWFRLCDNRWVIVMGSALSSSIPSMALLAQPSALDLLSQICSKNALLCATHPTKQVCNRATNLPAVKATFPHSK